jgi:hypothetical protein
MARPQDAVELLAKGGTVLAAGAKANAAFDATRRARQLVAQPRIAEEIKTHKAISAALVKFRTDKHPLHDAALLVAIDANIAKVAEQLDAVKLMLAGEPAMRQVLMHADKAMRQVREADRSIDRSRPCEDRLHLRRPGRASRRASNTRRRGSRRAAGVRTGQDPGDGSGDDDPPGSVGLPPAWGQIAGEAP